MQFLITDSSRRILTSIDVPDTPDGEPATIGIERADRPDLLYIGADLYANGTVVVGHWADGEEWDRLVHTAGVPGSCGHASPARPIEPTFTHTHLAHALATARAQMAASNADTTVLDVFVQATLDSLTQQAG